MITNIHRYFYLFYVSLWLIGEGQYLYRMDYSAIDGGKNYDVINEMILVNFLFGSIGIIFSLLILSSKKIGVYFICTCAIGLAIAGGTLYLDSLVTGNAAQAHMNSVLAFFIWLIPVVSGGWIGIVKDIRAAINKQRDDR
jgi:Zn-dependent protease